MERPVLAQLFEAVAGVMDLDRGQQRLELIFHDGRLTQFWTHAEKRPLAELADFNGRASALAAAFEAGELPDR